jgi:uracil-DNA glycosylase
MSETYFLSPDSDDQPRSMRDANVVQRRQAMLHLPHIAPLTAYAAGLHQGGTAEVREVPDFDPLDGGVGARLLFLFEKPGPMAAESSKRTGSGFVSRNNDDATAEATFKFMEQAGIPRKLTVIWNLVPWWNGTRKVSSKELRQGSTCVEELVKLLPSLSAVVMVGKSAARAKQYLETTGLTLISSYHPSPIVKATSLAKWETIPFQWAKAMTIVAEGNYFGIAS